MRTGLVRLGRGVIVLGCFVFSSVLPGAESNSPAQAKQAKPFSYFHDEVPEVPWSIYVCKIERGNDLFEFYTTLGKGSTIGMAAVSEQVKRLPASIGQPIAAVNGDFFTREEPYEGDPRDLQIRGGELVSAPTGHSCFWIDAHGEPQMTNVQSRFRLTLPDKSSLPFELNAERGKGDLVLYTQAIGVSTRTSGGIEYVITNADTNWLPLQIGKRYNVKVSEVRNGGDSRVPENTILLSIGPKLQDRFKGIGPGTALSIATETFPDLTGSITAIGGGPALVRNGKSMSWPGVQPRHPRAALGWNKEYYFLMEVDGRQAKSTGMTLTELSEYMAKLGCETALNLDGGGSATMWVLGSVMNNPSEGQERPAANALVVLKKERKKEGADSTGNQANGSSDASGK
jgi:hypothetical protein